MLRLLAIIVVSSIFACKATHSAGRHTPTFAGSRAFADLAETVARGHRYYGAAERMRALEAIEARFQPSVSHMARQPMTLPHPDGTGTLTLINVLARQHSDRKRRIVLSTHWDTRLWAEEDPDPERRDEPIAGANDGTSGLVLLTEIARVLSAAPLRNFGVDYVLFDGEEFGRPGSGDYCQGSRYLAKHVFDWYPDRSPEAAIVVDMVGDRDLRILREAYSMAQAEWLQDIVWDAAIRLREPAFVDERSREIYDDHVPLAEAGIPAILLIDYDYPHWHTHSDTPEQCSAESLGRVGRVVLQALRRLDATR